MRAYLAHARAEVGMTLRRGESLLLAVGIPLVLLLFLSGVEVLPVPEGDRRIDYLAPGVLALAVLSTGLVTLAIATGFERSYLVLKRLAVSPLSRPALLAAKVTAVLVVEALQVAVLAPVAVLLGWRPGGGVLPALAAVLVATAAFAGLGLLMAGALPAEFTLALSNGVYLLLLLVGGVVVPLSSLPGPLQVVAKGLPSTALAALLREAVGTGAAAPRWAWPVLVAWAVVAPVLAALTFRWE